jgi:hypothetical protein
MFYDILPLLKQIKSNELQEKLIKIYTENESAIRYFPASISHHHCWEGGYYDHISQVIVISVTLFDMMSKIKKFDFTKDDVILVAFAHDFDKLHRYEKTKDSWKIKKGINWDYRSDFPNCDESAKVVQLFAKCGVLFEDKHIEAISLHHGGFSTKLSSVYSGKSGRMSNLSTILHSADMLSADLFGDNKNITLKQN